VTRKPSSSPVNGPSSVVVDRLGHRFGAAQVLDGVDLRIPGSTRSGSTRSGSTRSGSMQNGPMRGGVVTILGANGSGKTTLLRCLATIIAPDVGAISIDGLDPRHEQQRLEIRRRLGYLPQEFGASPGATVFDMLDVVGVLKGIRDDRRRRWSVFEVLDRVGLRDVVAKRATDLSTGMRRRVGLAAALLGAPSLLVLDEPASAFDSDEQARLRTIVAEYRRDATIVMSTHLIEHAADSDSVVVMARGGVSFAGSPAALARQADGRAWITSGLPPPDVRASWRQVDGRYRCLGTPPPGAELVPATIEDGYVLLTG
jgi:ABC-2 type transport system ATP-binding protein